MKPISNISNILNVLKGSSASFQVNSRAKSPGFQNASVRKSAPENQAPQTQIYEFNLPNNTPNPSTRLHFFSSFLTTTTTPLESTLYSKNNNVDGEITREKILVMHFDELGISIKNADLILEEHKKNAFIHYVENSFDKILIDIPNTIDEKMKNKEIAESLENSYSNHFGFRIAKKLDQLIQQKLTETEKNGLTHREALANFINEKNEDGIKTKTLLLRSIAAQLSTEGTPDETLDKMTENWIQSSLQRAIMAEMDKKILNEQGNMQGLLLKSLTKNKALDGEAQKERLNNKIAQVRQKIDNVFDDAIYKTVSSTEVSSSTNNIYTKNSVVINANFANKTAENTIKILDMMFAKKISDDSDQGALPHLENTGSIETQSNVLFETPDSGDESDTDSDIFEPTKNEKKEPPLLKFITRDRLQKTPTNPFQSSSSSVLKFKDPSSEDSSI